MLRKNKKTIIFSLLVLICTLSTIMIVKADSGWDSSYDFGSSFDSGSSWSGGSSSWDYSSSSSSGGISSSGSFVDFIIYLVIIIVIILIVSSKTAKVNKLPKTIINPIHYTDMDIEKIKEVDSEFNIEKFKTTAFNIYKDIQTAWMDFDTDTIRNLTTDELYNMYSAQLTTLKVKKQKNIMKNIEYIDSKIVNVKNNNDINTVVVYLNVKCLDYVVDEKTNNTLRGSDTNRLNIEYLLTFVKDSKNNKEIEKCPNCGAPVDIIGSATCAYCNSVLVKNASKYVLSKKSCIGQKIDK